VNSSSPEIGPKSGFGRRYFPAFRHRYYRWYFWGQSISLIGLWVQNTALANLVFRTTESPFLLGLITFLGQIPILILGPFAGVLADRHSRHRIVVITQILLMAQALVLTVFVFRGYSQFWVLGVFSLILGTIVSFDLPARQALVIELVGREDLPNAIALGSLLFNSARGVGPALAAPFLLLYDEGWFFLVNGLTYMVVIAPMVRMRLKPRAVVQPTGGFLSNIVEAFDFVRSHIALRDILLNVGMISVLLIPHAVLLPAVAREIVGEYQPQDYARLLAVSGFGALAGALLFIRGTWDPTSARLIPLGGIMFALTLIAFSFSPSIRVASTLLVPAGVSMMIQTIGTNTFVQSLVPDRYRGRVLSFMTTMFLGFIPIGSLVLGALANFFGALVVIRCAASICLLGSLLLLSRASIIRASIDELRRLGHS